MAYDLRISLLNSLYRLKILRRELQLLSRKGNLNLRGNSYFKKGESVETKTVGVVSCGVMGSGIAQVCAQAGYQVVVSEINEELLNKGLASINLFLAKGVERGKVTVEDKEAALNRIKGATNARDFSSCDLVIEAVPENMELKKKVFAQLGEICSKESILATNTSVLSVIDMAVVSGRPSKVVGLHFFNPVPIMRPVEVVRTILTSNETMDIAKAFVESLGKTIVVAKDTPGFIVDRLSIAFILNAIRMLEAGVATAEDIDRAVSLGLNHPMGPFQLADLVGLDTLVAVSTSLYEQLGDPQYTLPTIVRKMVTAGWLGRKTRRGFYEYGECSQMLQEQKE